MDIYEVADRLIGKFRPNGKEDLDVGKGSAFNELVTLFNFTQHRLDDLRLLKGDSRYMCNYLGERADYTLKEMYEWLKEIYEEK